MNEMNFDWDDLRLFLAVARGGGLAAAAATTHESAPTLGRRMLAFERKLGKDLFRRKARGYELTEAGETLLEKVAVLEARLLPLLEIDPAPPIVKISAGTWVTQLLCSRVAELGDPGTVRLQFISAEATLDMGRRETLIGIRNRRPSGPGLARRKIGNVQFAVYAVHSGIATWARVVSSTPSAKWVQTQSGNSEVIEVTNPRNALDLALQGTARVVLPTFVGDKVQGLKPISNVIPELDHDQWLVTHHEDRFIPEVRRVIERTYRVLSHAHSGD